MALVQPQVVAIEAPRLHAYLEAMAHHMPCTYMAAISRRDETAVQGAPYQCGYRISRGAATTVAPQMVPSDQHSAQRKQAVAVSYASRHGLTWALIRLPYVLHSDTSSRLPEAQAVTEVAVLPQQVYTWPSPREVMYEARMLQVVVVGSGGTVGPVTPLLTTM